MKLCFLDTETTGLDHERCQVWEIGVIVRNRGGDTEYLWQIRPDLSTAEPNGLRIGRYYERCLLTRYPVGEAWKVIHPDHAGDSEREYSRRTDADLVACELAKMLDGAYVVGAVPWFDERFLQRFLRDNGQAAVNHYHLVDVEALAGGALKMAPPWGFDDILAAYGLTYDEADRHTAIGDARMVRDLYDAVLASGTEA